MKILEIDDNPDIIKFVELTVTSMGHEFFSTDNGQEGIKRIQENQYDVVLLDLSMPEFSGIDVINELNKKNLMKNQKVVVFTASSGSDSGIEELKRKGIHSYLTKPIDIDLLMEKINELEKSL